MADRLLHKIVLRNGSTILVPSSLPNELKKYVPDVMQLESPAKEDVELDRFKRRVSSRNDR